MKKKDPIKSVKVTTRTTESITIGPGELIEILRAAGRISPEGSVTFRIDTEYGDEILDCGDSLYIETVHENTVCS